MFDDDLPKPKTHEFPRPLDNLSVEELDAYVEALKAEIDRAQQDKDRKNGSRAAAESFFKG